MKITGELSQLRIHPETHGAKVQLKPAAVGRVGSPGNFGLYLSLDHQLPSTGFSVN